MIAGVQLKVCGLTSLVDAEWAGRCGADFLGFVLHAASPRRITLGQFAVLRDLLPGRKKVAVSVEPAPDDLAAQQGAGFDFFQIHFRLETPEATVAEWSQLVGPQRLWLAPRLPPGAEVPAAVRAAARCIVLDTYRPDGFGGSGRAGDWSSFARHREQFPGNQWVLAGGLKAGNIADALAASGARAVDVNSGVETAPGVKDAEKLRAFVEALR
ncbi:MAG: phosphoribosylanthranilate isomerase, partial [Verrucomicrobia bacterium]|nr:phosphoribosylanthranilate isomerase [Verrucomicrobiota bacterium]